MKEIGCSEVEAAMITSTKSILTGNALPKRHHISS